MNAFHANYSLEIIAPLIFCTLILLTGLSTDPDFVEFLGLAGLGQAEAASLTWDDVDLKHKRLSIRRHKTNTRFYSKFRNGIIDHPTNVTDHNIGELQQMSFVFVCIDDGPSRKLIISRLQEWAIPLADVGMGLYLAEGAIGGIVRVTTSTANRPLEVDIAKRIPFAANEDNNNEYRTNIQIADLNALNAALAVIRWKKMCGFYHDFDQEHHCTYTIDGNLLTNDDKAKAQCAVKA